uniref:Ovule protein n=1 Tax=Caenorhabditis tropicalis TaxID=1561998 RepID=A0A1I7U2N4_9PELO
MFQFQLTSRKDYTVTVFTYSNGIRRNISKQLIFHFPKELFHWKFDSFMNPLVTMLLLDVLSDHPFTEFIPISRWVLCY